MDPDEINIARYQAAADNEKYEGDMVWQTFSAFLLAQTIFLAFLLQSLFGKNNSIGYYPGVCFAAFFGFIICIPWFLSFKRSMAYLDLRRDQAKDAEPDGWNLLKGESVEEKYFIIPKWIPKIIADKLTTRFSVALLIFFFAIVYLVIIFLSGPWNPTLPIDPKC